MHNMTNKMCILFNRVQKFSKVTLSPLFAHYLCISFWRVEFVPSLAVYGNRQETSNRVLTHFPPGQPQNLNTHSGTLDW